jgi:hypothetical protein
MNRLQRSAAAGVAVAIAVFTAGASLAFVSADRTEENVLICHRTASDANPYNLIPVNPNGYDGHDQHPGDLIPAPGGTCPSQPPTPTPTPTPTETVTPASPATPEPIEPVDADETALVEPAEPVIQPDEDTAVEPASPSRVPISVPAGGGGAASGDQ